MSAPNIDNLLKQLTSENWEKRQTAADTLANLGVAAKEALPPLRDQLLVEDDDDVQGSIIRAISRVNDNPTAVIQELLGYLGHSYWRIRQIAAEVLGEMGTSAKESSSALWTRLLTEDDSDVLDSATTAIVAVESDKAALLAKCLEYLKDGNAKKSYAALRVINALEPTGTDASKVSDALWQTLSADGNSDNTTLAFTTLVEISSNRSEVLKNLLANDRITNTTKSRLVLLPEVSSSLAEVWSEQKAVVLDLVIKRLEDDPSNNAIINWITEKSSEISGDSKSTILNILSRIFKQTGSGFTAITKLGGPDWTDALLNDGDVREAIMGRTLLIEAAELLNKKWNTEKDRVLTLILAALEPRDFEARYKAAEWLKNKASEIPSSHYNRVVEALTRIQNERRAQPPEVVSAVNAALIQLRQRERDIRTSPLLDLIRDRKAKEDVKVEAIAKLVEAGSRDALRVVTGEWVGWIASGNKSLVESTAEAMRSSPFAVQSLVDLLLHEWRPDAEQTTTIRNDEVLPFEHRSLLREAYYGARLPQEDKDRLAEWLSSVGQTSEAIIELKKTASLNKWTDERLTKEIIDQLLKDELALRALRVQQRIAKQLADMSDPKFFDDDALKEIHRRIREELKRHAIPVLGRRLPKEGNVEIRESMAQALGYIGGREAIEALSRAVAGEERIRSARQELLARYYLEPSKARSEEAANILKEAADEAKRTLRLQHRLNVSTFAVGLLILTAGLLTCILVPDTTTRVVGAVAGIGGFAGLLTQMIKAPIDRVQHAMANLVQIETAFTSFIWELNLNGTYIQSQYVAEGVLTDNEISQTVGRIEEAMNLAMNLVAVYTQDRGQRIVTRLNNLLPASGGAGATVTVIGQHLRGDSSEKKDRAGMIAINHVPINATDLSWNEHEVKFKLPTTFNNQQESTVWISLFVDGMETNSLPFHLINAHAALPNP